MKPILHPIYISEQLLLALKLDQPFGDLIAQLASIDHGDFDLKVVSDDAKKTFWINVYNAYFLILRKYHKVAKTLIYNVKEILIAGKNMSLDDIEHGILRRYRLKVSLGYLPNVFAPSWIKKWAVKELDYRIHFALNCGAVSCPPIAFYRVENIAQQLSLATTLFLENETKINHETKTIYSTKLFQWYQGDFGGTTGIKKLLSDIFVQNLQAYKLLFNDYDLTDDLDNFLVQ